LLINVVDFYKKAQAEMQRIEEMQRNPGASGSDIAR